MMAHMQTTRLVGYALLVLAAVGSLFLSGFWIFIVTTAGTLLLFSSDWSAERSRSWPILNKRQRAQIAGQLSKPLGTVEVWNFDTTAARKFGDDLVDLLEEAGASVNRSSGVTAAFAGLRIRHRPSRSSRELNDAFRKLDLPTEVDEQELQSVDFRIEIGESPR